MATDDKERSGIKTKIMFDSFLGTFTFDLKLKEDEFDELWAVLGKIVHNIAKETREGTR